MSAWFDNEPFGYIEWGWSTGGIDGGSGTEGQFPDAGVQTPLLDTSALFCRPPDGSSHLLIETITFFDASNALLGGWELWAADYFLAVDPTYPTGYSFQDTTPSVSALSTDGVNGPYPTAAFYIACILDLGPYDGTGTTTAVSTADYSPYTDIDTAIANITCGGAGGANITGARGVDLVLFS